MALMGIGFGINVIMLGIEWQKTVIDAKFAKLDIVQKIAAMNGITQ